MPAEIRTRDAAALMGIAVLSLQSQVSRGRIKRTRRGYIDLAAFNQYAKDALAWKKAKGLLKKEGTR